MADDMPDFVKRALINDRLTQLRADQDTELEDYLATLPTPIHLIVDLPELNERTEHNHAEYINTQRELLAGEVRCDALRRRLAVLREERTEHNHAEYINTQRELLAGEVRCDALRRRLAVLRAERIELDNRRRGLESNV